jgi:hypothetical protein
MMLAVVMVLSPPLPGWCPNRLAVFNCHRAGIRDLRFAEPKSPASTSSHPLASPRGFRTRAGDAAWLGYEA